MFKGAACVVSRAERRRRARTRQKIPGKTLHRHVAIEPRVPRAKHLAHPACANRRGNLVGTEAMAFREMALLGAGAHLSKPTFFSSASLRCESALYPTMSVNMMAASLRCSLFSEGTKGLNQIV